MVELGSTHGSEAWGSGPQKGIDGFFHADSVKKIGNGPCRERRQLVEALERHYPELNRISCSWLLQCDGAVQPPVDVAKTVGVPGAILGAILAGKCRDQHIPVTVERQKRFAEWMHMHCDSLWFTLNDSGAGPECAKGVVLALALNDRFTSLNLACNTLGNAGAAIIAKALPEHQTLLHLDLAANDIGHAGGNALFAALQANRSVTYVDMSSRPGSLRNHLARYNAGALERLLICNPVLAKLQLMGNSLGVEGAAGLARGLAQNTSLISLDLAGNDLGPRGFAALADALACCGLEELNLSDNRAGDEGLSALATRLGALPPAPADSSWTSSAPPSSAWASTGEGMKASMKYYEALSSLSRAVSDLSPDALQMRDENAKQDLARVSSYASALASSLEAVTIAMPKLRSLSLAGNNATNNGIARIEDALQVNRCLERLNIDQSDHRLEWGSKSLVTALPVNTTLKHLSLCQCGLASASIVELSKALALNDSLESLSLRGNPFNQEAAAAMGAWLGTGARCLRQLNLASCRLEDTSGVSLGTGLATNAGLETLHLRDNLLREAAGRTIADALRKHTSLIQLNLELNSIDFRFLQRIKQLLERNSRLRERAKPKWYRKRIDELMECEKEVKVLENTLKRNFVRKRKARLKQAAALQELKDVQGEEEKRQGALESELAKVREMRESVDEEIQEAQERLHSEVSAGDNETNKLNLEIAAIEERIAKHKKHMEQTRAQLDSFENQAKDGLAVVNGDLVKAEKERDIASASSEAAHRHLDNFAAAMKSIEPDIAGGADPRQRLLEQEQQRQAPLAARQPVAPNPKTTANRPAVGRLARPKPALGSIAPPVQTPA